MSRSQPCVSCLLTHLLNPDDALVTSHCVFSSFGSLNTNPDSALVASRSQSMCLVCLSDTDDALAVFCSQNVVF
ncbi:hypothetical protein BDR04DRAFT_1098874 [Suillus decipiens]|nr:hypothetical protein BDR04DRAFT_1098874 [Suillus decipiens]